MESPRFSGQKKFRLLLVVIIVLAFLGLMFLGALTQGVALR
jgi:hypothetical protein